MASIIKNLAGVNDIASFARSQNQYPIRHFSFSLSGLGGGYGFIDFKDPGGGGGGGGGAGPPVLFVSPLFFARTCGFNEKDVFFLSIYASSLTSGFWYSLNRSDNPAGCPHQAFAYLEVNAFP